MRAIETHLGEPNTSFFVDPPYAVNGTGPGCRLYRFSEIDHERLFQILARAAGPWLMSYHDSREIRRLAKKCGFAVRSIEMVSTHHREKTELLISPMPSCGGVSRKTTH